MFEGNYAVRKEAFLLKFRKGAETIRAYIGSNIGGDAAQIIWPEKKWRSIEQNFSPLSPEFAHLHGRYYNDLVTEKVPKPSLAMLLWKASNEGLKPVSFWMKANFQRPEKAWNSRFSLQEHDTFNWVNIEVTAMKKSCEPKK